MANTTIVRKHFCTFLSTVISNLHVTLRPLSYAFIFRGIYLICEKNQVEDVIHNIQAEW